MTETQYDKAMEELERELEEGNMTTEQFRCEVSFLNEEWEEANAGSF